MQLPRETAALGLLGCCERRDRRMHAPLELFHMLSKHVDGSAEVLGLGWTIHGSAQHGEVALCHRLRSALEFPDGGAVGIAWTPASPVVLSLLHSVPAGPRSLSSRMTPRWRATVTASVREATSSLA